VAAAEDGILRAAQDDPEWGREIYAEIRHSYDPLVTAFAPRLAEQLKPLK
jgi:hypothetical protein